MEGLFVRYGEERWYFDPPADWNILTFARFHDRADDRDVEDLTKDSLNNPVLSPPLKEIVSTGDRVAILIEDQTRASPKKAILRALLQELHEARIPRENIAVIVALGTHRALSREKLEEVYGEDTVRDYTVLNHDSKARDLVPVGKLKTGAVVKINRVVAEATFRVGIGSIFPHSLNGFGGGGKILFPGVSNFDAIMEHHLKYSFRNGCEAGRLRGNPFYEEVCAVTGMTGLHFILNSVLDQADRLYTIVCGDPIEAHVRGAEVCRSLTSRRFSKKADVTLISAFPYTEGPQIVKPLGPASVITRDGGVIILVARCTSPLPDEYRQACEGFRMKCEGPLRAGVFELFERNRPVVDGGAPELNMSAAQALLTQDRFKVILVSRDVPPEHAQHLGFRLARDMREAFATTATLIQNPDVHVVPSGGILLPVLQVPPL